MVEEYRDRVRINCYYVFFFYSFLSFFFLSFFSLFIDYVSIITFALCLFRFRSPKSLRSSFPASLSLSVRRARGVHSGEFYSLGARIVHLLHGLSHFLRSARLKSSGCAAPGSNTSETRIKLSRRIITRPPGSSQFLPSFLSFPPHLLFCVFFFLRNENYTLAASSPEVTRGYLRRIVQS